VARRRLLDEVGRGEIGEALSQVHRLVLDRQRRDLGEDRRADAGDAIGSDGTHAMMVPVTSIRQGGFVVPYGMQTWRSFVEDGDLGRTLVRMCVLAERVVPLSFVLDRGPAFGVKVSFILAGESIDVVCGPSWSKSQRPMGWL
jgi:hypothetical protein